MGAYQVQQEFNDVRWGTMMPVTVMVGGQIVEVRARGRLSVTVVDPARLAAEVPDPEALSEYLSSRARLGVMDLIGERSTQAATIAQLTTVTPEVTQALQTRLNESWAALGLKVKSVVVEAIETV